MKKIIITVIITFIVSIVASSIPGYLLYAPHQLELSGQFPNTVPPIPDFSFMILGALFFMVFTVVVFDKMGINNLKSCIKKYSLHVRNLVTSFPYHPNNIFA